MQQLTRQNVKKKRKRQRQARLFWKKKKHRLEEVEFEEMKQL